MAQQLSDIYASLNSAYNPQRDVYNQQLGQVDQQSQGAIAGANAQKDTAFQGITNQANNNGMFYSGAPIKEEQMYTGGTYAPAIANIQNAAQNQKYSLQGALAGVGVNQTNQANQIYGTQLGQDQQQRQYQQSYNQQAQQNQQMLGMQNAYNTKMQGGGGGGGGQQSPSFAASHDSSGGWQVTGPGGQAATLAQYAGAHGGTVQQYLSQGSAGDRQLAQQMARLSNPQQQQQFMQAHPNIFGGV